MYDSVKSDSKLGELNDEAVALISSKSKWTFARFTLPTCRWQRGRPAGDARVEFF
jgi:hypothetical protein